MSPGASGLRDQAFREILGPGRALGERLPQRDEVDLAMILRPFVEGAESRLRFRHHVEGKPGTRILLVAVPYVELRLAQLLEALGQAFGKGEQELAAELLDLFVEQRKIDLAAGEQLLAFGQRLAGLGLAMNDAAV